MAELTGGTDGEGLRMAIVVARWNGFVTGVLLQGALSTLRGHGVRDEAIQVIHVPGSFEIPTAALWAAQSDKADAVICLGAVIRGETAHFEYVSAAAQQGILDVSLRTGVPVVFGVLTVDTVEQAMARAGGKEGHKGEEAALTALEMANLRRALSETT